MTNVLEAAAPAQLSSTQKGTIGELIVSAGILEASNGRLSPFKPVADDDGLDLLVLDKDSRRTLAIQVKCRRGVDHPDAQTVEFDIRLKTFVEAADGYVLCVRMEGFEAKTFWLIPSSELRRIAREKNGLLVVVASAKPGSADKFSRYRLTTFAQVVEKIRARTGSATGDVTVV